MSAAEVRSPIGQAVVEATGLAVIGAVQVYVAAAVELYDDFVSDGHPRHLARELVADAIRETMAADLRADVDASLARQAVEAAATPPAWMP